MASLFSKFFKRGYDSATPAQKYFGAGRERFHSYRGEDARARERTQERSRYHAKNDPLANNIVDVQVMTKVGAGIVPTSQHSNLNTRKVLDTYFERWTKRADFLGRTSFHGLIAAGVKAERTDGETFLVWHGDQLQLIPAERIDSTKTADLADGGCDQNGVRLDRMGRPTGFWVLPDAPSSSFPHYAEPVFVPVSEMLHLFVPSGPDSVRGVSHLAPVLMRISEMAQTEAAFQKNILVAALLSVVLTNENDVSAEDPFEDGQSLEPGAILKMSGGWKFNQTATRAVSEINGFLDHQKRMICAGVGVPEHLATGDTRHSNYSSSRAALVSFRQKIEQYQFHTLVPQVLDPIWRRVITYGILSGEIEAADFEANPDDYFAVEWIPPAQPWVDPLKDAQATALMIDRGLMSRRQAVAQQGYSIESLDAEIAADRTREAALGLSFGSESKPLTEDDDQ